jgi:hypothetical protein
MLVNTLMVKSKTNKSLTLLMQNILIILIILIIFYREGTMRRLYKEGYKI